MADYQDIERQPEAPKEHKCPAGFAINLSEPFNWDFARGVLGEFFGTLFFLWSTISTVVFFRVPFFQPTLEVSSPVGGELVFSEGDSATQLMIATSFGLSIVVLVYAFADISGGHINPAVTWALTITGQCSVLRGVLYIVAQLVGAIVGTAIVKGIDSSTFDAANGGANGVFVPTNGGAVLGEIMGTAGLVFTVLSACDQRTKGNITAYLVIGISVWIAHLSLIPVTGTSINPARSFGPAVVADVWDDQWVFWVGPIAGSTIAALIHQTLFRST